MSETASDSSAELLARIARLERRLARESQVRGEAEAIAEAGTRALYDQTRRLSLLETVAMESNRAGSTEHMLDFTLKQVCEFTGWPLGHVYLRDEASDPPIMSSTRQWWARPGLDFEVFRQASEAIVFKAGVGLAGRVMAGAEAIWSHDLANDGNFLRAPMAKQCGLCSGIAFPVMVGDEVAAVFEFFLERQMAPDEALLRMLDKIGAVVGRSLERDRAERLSQAANLELQRMVVEAQAASAAKTAFLAVTSHEVRTPLNAVMGLAEALSRAKMPDDQRELVDGIRDSGALLLRLLNAVLDIAKIESGRAPLIEAPFDLEPLAQTVVRLWRPKAREDGVDIVVDLSGMAQPCWLHADGGKVEQTLINLVSNAVKFTPRGGQVLVRLSSREEDGAHAVLAEVLDQGPGVPAVDRERIFRPYEQTSVGREAGGAGLGLAICAGNIAAMGGQIGVDGRDGEGSRFWFAFTAAVAEPAQSELETLDKIEGRPLRVLAAEDNPANREVLRLLLEPVGVIPDFVEDGALAVAAAMAAPYDLILMDAQMPNMDGVTATRRIRGTPGPCARTPIHMLTANVFEDDVRRYREAGADRVIAKPIVVADLYAALSEAADEQEAAA